MALQKIWCDECGTSIETVDDWGWMDAGWTYWGKENGGRGTWQCGNCSGFLEKKAKAAAARSPERLAAEAAGYDLETIQRFQELVSRLSFRGALTDRLLDTALSVIATLSCAVAFPDLTWSGDTWNGTLAEPESYEAL